MGSLEIVLGIAGVAIAWMTYQKTFLAKPTEEKEHLLMLFRATQQLSKSVREKLRKIASDKELFNSELFPGITYVEYINQMEESYKINLSDNLYDTIKKSNYTKTMIKSMTTSLEEQNRSLLQIDAFCNIHLPG